MALFSAALAFAAPRILNIAKSAVESRIAGRSRPRNQRITGLASATPQIFSPTGRGIAAPTAPTRSTGPVITGLPHPGSTVETRGRARVPDTVIVNTETGEVTERPRRRRRRRMLTCADRADISFITATLGKGSGGQQAIAQLLSRCN